MIINNMIKKTGYMIVFIIMFSNLIVGCQKNDSNPENVSSEEENESVSSLPIISSDSDAYPGPVSEAEPTMDSSNPFGTVRFQLNPVKEGDLRVSGVGPAGINLEVFDITFVEVLGSGVIDETNQFSIDLAEPIVAGRLIGIQLSIPKDAQTWSNLWALKGDNARSVPSIGYFFDTQISQP